MTRLLAAAVFAALAGPAAAGPWFLHSFGELRSYHGHFLDVCAEGGAGDCRAVQYRLPAGGDPFFGDAALRIHRLDDGYAVEVYVQGLPDVVSGPVIVSVGGEVIPLPEGSWEPGVFGQTNVAETFVVTDAALNARLVDLMRGANGMRVQVPGAEEVRFSMIGLTEALDAIDTHRAAAR